MSGLLDASLASLLAEQHRDAEAVERYRMALDCYPSHAESFCGLRHSLVVLGRRYDLDEIRTEPFPSGHTSRAWGRMVCHPNGQVEDDP